MDEASLYETQYGPARKLVSSVSFPFLRKVFRKFDLHREVLALQLLEPGGSLLDVGCGRGSLLFKAKDKFEQRYGIDISPSRIDLAQRYVIENFLRTENFHFSVVNVNRNLDFPDNMFNAVTAMEVIEHVFDPYFVVGEIHRVLKKGGIFIANVPNIAYIKHRINLLLGRLPVTSSPYNWKQIGWDGGHLHYFTAKTFSRLLEESGFVVLKITGSGLFAKFRNFYPSLLTGDICVKARKC